MKVFENFKEAHEYYNYPSSHRFGTIYDKNGVIRSYSNGKYDIVKDNFNIFYYMIKNNKIKEEFNKNRQNKKPIRLFYKYNSKVLDLGLYYVKSFYKNYVKLSHKTR